MVHELALELEMLLEVISELPVPRGTRDGVLPLSAVVPITAAAGGCLFCPFPFCCHYVHFDFCFFKLFFFLHRGFSSFFVSSENDFPYALLYLGLWGRK